MALNLGLKQLRRNTTDSQPRYKCDNCNCIRYSPCYCMKSEKKERKNAKNKNSNI